MNAALTHQIERLRAVTVEERLRQARALWEQARDVLAAGVRARHPDWPEAHVAAGVRELMRDASP